MGCLKPTVSTSRVRRNRGHFKYGACCWRPIPFILPRPFLYEVYQSVCINPGGSTFTKLVSIAKIISASWIYRTEKFLSDVTTVTKMRTQDEWIHVCLILTSNTTKENERQNAGLIKCYTMHTRTNVELKGSPPVSGLWSDCPRIRFFKGPLTSLDFT